MTHDMHFPDSLHTIAKPVHKNTWALPAVINFILGSTAAGYYILWKISAGAHASGAGGGFLAAGLALAGFAVLALEAGRPSHARYLLANWRDSWMSIEAASGMVFIGMAVIDALTARPLIGAVALGAACAFLLSQAMMPFNCRAVPTWREAALPVLFISSGLTGGYALILFNRFDVLLGRANVAMTADIVALAGLMINFAAWMTLVRGRRNRALPAPVRPFLPPGRIAVIAGLGQVLPVLVLLSVRPWSLASSRTAALSLVLAAAAAILAGNGIQKTWLLRRAQNLCGMQLDGAEWD